MSSREERERLARELEARGLVPTRPSRPRSDAEAEQVARRVTRRRRVTAHQAVIILLEQRELTRTMTNDTPPHPRQYGERQRRQQWPDETATTIPDRGAGPDRRGRGVRPAPLAGAVRQQVRGRLDGASTRLGAQPGVFEERATEILDELIARAAEANDR